METSSIEYLDTQVTPNLELQDFIDRIIAYGSARADQKPGNELNGYLLLNECSQIAEDYIDKTIALKNQIVKLKRIEQQSACIERILESERYLRLRMATWLAKGDHGRSSLTMANITMGATEGDFGAPYSPADLGRCIRLVRQIPEVRQNFYRISALCTTFKPIFASWEDLCEVYDRDFKTGKSRDLQEILALLRKNSS